MRAIQVATPGGADALTLVDVEPPEPAAGQVRVAVSAAGVNFRDVYERAGLYPMPMPFIAGAEGVGTVTALGPGASEFALGDRIAWKEARGRQPGATEYVLVEAFADDAAGAHHVTTAHFKEAQVALPPHLAETPRIINVTVPGTDWSELEELSVSTG